MRPQYAGSVNQARPAQCRRHRVSPDAVLRKLRISKHQYAPHKPQLRHCVYLMLILRGPDMSFPDVCDLCLEDMEANSMFRQLPCGHLLHKACVDTWLISRDASCPLCRRTFYHLRVSKLPRVHTTECGGRNNRDRARSFFIPRWIKRGLNIS